METAPLKKFATEARKTLLAEIDARIGVVLAPYSNERNELPRVVGELEKAIAAEGGGDKGRAAVADKVAYTWFNRIIALRFMDANGYTGIGVVSPEPGREGGQPEILAEAKQGRIDGDVVSERTAEAVTKLLNNARRSDDPQGEAYGLLLAEYCRYWNRTMPFMFERDGDYTELLMPGRLLADDSVMSRAAAVLTKEACEEVEVIGWLYQFYISERKDEVFKDFKKNKKAGAAEIPAATQLFTPHWIVRYLVENSLGRLWLLNRPTSQLAEQMDYYIEPVDEETDFLKIDSPEELKLIDPACGSGHMLTYAFDLLYAIYEEEGYSPSEIPGFILENNLYGTEIDPRAGALAAFALTMKARARQRTFFNKKVRPQICVLEPISFTQPELDLLVTPNGDREAEAAFWNQFQHADSFGSLICPDRELLRVLKQRVPEEAPIDLLGNELHRRVHRVVAQAEILSVRYHAVVVNPPYMRNNNMAVALAEFVNHRFPDSKADLFAAFIERCLGLSAPAGFVAMITMQSWMFLASYSKFRSNLVARNSLLAMAHLGERAFDSIGGSVVSTTAFIVQCKQELKRQAIYYRLTEGRSETEKAAIARECIKGLRDRLTFYVPGEDFTSLPGAPIAYWFPGKLMETFKSSSRLSNIARTAKGMVTGNNEQFVREWWEVSVSNVGFGFVDREQAKSSGKKWFPYAKGGEFRRWAGNLDSVVNWENDGYALQNTLTPDRTRVRATNFNLDRIFNPGIAWTVVTSSNPSFRAVGPGFLFADAAGICQSADNEYVLALLNSSSARQVLQGLNPTLNLQPGNLNAVPTPPDSRKEEARTRARKAISISSADWNLRERSWGFVQSPLLGKSSSLAISYSMVRAEWAHWVEELRSIEEENNLHFALLFGLGDSDAKPPVDAVSLNINPDFYYSADSKSDREAALHADTVREFISYAVGCMFGRFSLDEPGLILADQGDTLQKYLGKVPDPSFLPDADNVIPIVDGDWFEDDIVARVRDFLRVAFGQEHFEENLRFVTEALEVKNLRSYFLKSFYQDHVKRYKKRPIYWMFSSPNGAFNALIYMHRYTPSTVSTVLEYLRQFQSKLEASRQHFEKLSFTASSPREKSKALKEAERLRKILVELDEYEHDVLYPLATEQIEIDLDDGVKANYPKFGAALKRIPGLEAKHE
jgi:hypothetical protein